MFFGRVEYNLSRMALLCWFSLSNILLLVELAVSEDPFKITENRDKWIDPNSMFSTDSLTENEVKLVNDDDVSGKKFCKFNHIMKEELAECRKKLLTMPKMASNCQCQFDEKSPCQSEVAAVKHMIRLLGRKLDINLDNPKSVSDSAQNYVVRLTVSQSDLATWNELLTETQLKHSTLIEALEKVGNMINTASLRTVVSESLIKQTNCTNNVSENDTSLVYIFTWLNFVALVVALGYIVLVIWRRSFFLFVTFMFCTLFALSFVWTWYHMYKTEQAKSMAILHKVSLSSCRRIEDMSIWQYIGHLYFKLEDTCTEYHKAVIVDPFLEVKPLKVLGVTISEFVFAPLEPLAKEINRSFAALRNNLSTYNFALLIITFLSLMVPLLLLIGRYRFRALYGMISVEPAAVTKNPRTIPIENKAAIDSTPSKKQLKRLHRKALLKLKN